MHSAGLDCPWQKSSSTVSLLTCVPPTVSIRRHTMVWLIKPLPQVTEHSVADSTMNWNVITGLLKQSKRDTFIRLQLFCDKTINIQFVAILNNACNSRSVLILANHMILPSNSCYSCWFNKVWESETSQCIKSSISCDVMFKSLIITFWIEAIYRMNLWCTCKQYIHATPPLYPLHCMVSHNNYNIP